MTTDTTKANAPGLRVDYAKQSPELVQRMLALGAALRTSSIEETIRDLVALRASQINGCAFCVDMHVKEAKIHGERELRLYHVPVWRESPLFTARERAALEWTEALTKLSAAGVPDEIFNRVRELFSEKELSDLTFAIVLINGWNRVSIGFRAVPGMADAIYGLDKAGLH